MNAVTLDFQHFKEEKSSQKGNVCVQQKRSTARTKTVIRDDAYWTKRAQELLSVHVDESLPTVSGRFGSFLY